MMSNLSTPKIGIKDTEQDLETNEHISRMAQGQANILVAVRCRPLTKREKDQNDTKIVHILDSKLIVIIDPYAIPNKRTKEKRYAFDYVFPESISQSEIFSKTTLVLIDGVLNGFNATVFAYGPTGAGKTYTMLGENDNFGIMLMSFLEIFTRIETLSTERKYSVRVSYLEIYNEVVRDLLNPSTAFLDIREDPNKGVVVSDLSELVANNSEEVIDCLRLGNRRRTCEPTEANLTSSRSHAILQIVLEYQDKAIGVESEVFTGKLSLIDLAGSERAANTKNRGIRLIEGANINKSLLALGNCINALYEANSKGIKAYIPYRDSKLTRLLKDSLGGKCRTVMIACISPFHSYYEDTHNTLEYANRTKNIKTKVERNVVNVDYHVSKYKEIIDELKGEVKELRKVLAKGKKPEAQVFDDNINYFLTDLENHFAKESKLKSSFYKLSNQIDELNEQILIQHNDLNNTRLKSSERSPSIKTQEDSLESLRQKLLTTEEKSKTLDKEIKALERKRKDFDTKWIDLPEDSITALRLSLQKHIIKLYESEKDHQRTQEQNKLKYKDLYISILELKLKDRLDFLEKHENSTPHSELKEKLYTKKFEEKSSNKNKAFSYRLQGERFLKKGLRSEATLPEISPKTRMLSHALSRDSKIPMYKGKVYDDSSSTSSATEIGSQKGKVGKKLEILSPKKRVFGRVVSNSENESAKFELPKISDKFKQSPYVLWKEDRKGKVKGAGIDMGKLAKNS